LASLEYQILNNLELLFEFLNPKLFPFKVFKKMPFFVQQEVFQLHGMCGAFPYHCFNKINENY